MTAIVRAIYLPMAVAIGASAAIAQEGDADLLLDAIEVTSERETAWGPIDGIFATESAAGTKTEAPIVTTPQSLSVIGAEQIRMQAAATVDAAVRYTPGVNSSAAGLNNSQDIVAIRGFSGENQFLDGLALPAGTLTSPRIEPYGLERITVLRGPASALYGATPPGGLLDMVSKRPTDYPLREVRLQAGNDDMATAALDVGGPIGAEGVLAWRLVGLVGQDGTQVDFDDVKRTFIAPSLTWRPTDATSITFLAQYQKDTSLQAFQVLPVYGTLRDNPGWGHLPTSRYIGEPFFDSYEHEHRSVGYALEHAFDNGLLLRQNLQYREQSVDSQAVSAATVTPGSPIGTDRWVSAETQDDTLFAVDTNLSGGFVTGPVAHQLMAGIDYRTLTARYTFATDGGTTMPTLDLWDPVYARGIARPTDLWSNDRNGQRQTGVYVQDEASLGRWTVFGNARHDWVTTSYTDELAGTPKTDTDDTATTGRLGVSYLLDNGLAPYAMVSSSFDPLVGTTFDGDPYVPTTAVQYEAGLKYQPAGGDVFLSAAVFQITQDDILTPDPDPAHIEAMPWAQVQLGQARVRGFEAEGRAALADDLQLIGAYTYLASEITEGTAADATLGNDLPMTPRNQAALWLDYTIPSGPLAGLGVGGGIRYKGSNYGDAANEFEMPAVTLYDAALRYDFGNLRPDFAGASLALNATNFFDEVYVANCQRLDACSYGERRRLVATLTYQF